MSRCGWQYQEVKLKEYEAGLILLSSLGSRSRVHGGRATGSGHVWTRDGQSNRADSD